MADQHSNKSLTKGGAKSTKGDGDTSRPSVSYDRRVPPKSKLVINSKGCLGRTWMSWAKILLFYLVYFTCLALFFSLLMMVFYSTLDTKRYPTYTGEESLLRNPGLGLRPGPTDLDQAKQFIIYSPSDYGSARHYMDSIDYLLKPYDKSRYHQNVTYKSCEGTLNGTENAYPKHDEVCIFTLDSTNSSCTEENRWGYSTSSPCIFLKLNKMIHWSPQPVQNITILPEGLRQHIDALDYPDALTKNVWVWCESETVELEQPSPGLPLHFFPYTNQKGYLSPLVPVRLRNLPSEQLVVVTCRAWADNILPRVNARPTGQLKLEIKVSDNWHEL